MAALDEQLSSVEQELVAASGGASLCAISRSGGQVDAIKYLEGRMAALRELRRLVRSSAEPDEVIAGALEEAATEWRDHLELVRAKDLGAAWMAYRAGGVDQLGELRERLSSERQP